METTNKDKWVVAKLGGSNMKSAEDFVSALNTLISLSKKQPETSFVFVFSALFNLTNELEVLATLYLQKDIFWRQKMMEIRKRLNDFVSRIFVFKNCPEEEQENLRSKWNDRIKNFGGIFEKEHLNDGALRDMVLAEGESITLFIVNMFLPLLPVDFVCVDPKEVIKTDENFGNAEILFDVTTDLVTEKFKNSTSAGKIFITAGFIGSTLKGITTTVGREGSDYVAAILAKILKADSLYLFKDVGAIFDSMENRKPIVKMTYADLDKKIKEGGPFKAIHPKVATCLNETGISILIASPTTGEVGTTISPN